MIISEKTGEILIQGKRIQLTKYETLALMQLNKKGVTTLEEIYEKIYKVKPKELKEYDRRLLYAIINRLRGKLKGSATIKSKYKYGYRLEVLNG